MTVTVQNVADVYGQTVDTARVTALIADATTLCLSYIDPLPAAADVIIKNMVIRTYSNPTGSTSETVGPYTVQRPGGGIYLTRSERRNLRRLAGGGGAFTIDPSPSDAGAYTEYPQTNLDPFAPNPFFPVALLDEAQE